MKTYHRYPRKYYVGVVQPYLSEKYLLKVKDDFESFSDLVSSIDDVITPLSIIKAINKAEAKRIYCKKHPKIRKTIETTHINVKTS